MAIVYPRGWHSRGYLPHFDGVDEIQFVTCRLFDALPAEVVRGFKLRAALYGKRGGRKRYLAAVEKWLDRGMGQCFLAVPEVAEIAVQALVHYHEIKRYFLNRWVVMPNHVHFLVSINGQSLSQVLKDWKSYTAHAANRVLGRTGPFWQVDYFDRWIRDESHFVRCGEYIDNNPVAAGLCTRAEDWPYNSRVITERGRLVR